MAPKIRRIIRILAISVDVSSVHADIFFFFSHAVEMLLALYFMRASSSQSFITLRILDAHEQHT